MKEAWECVYTAESAHIKAKNLQSLLLEKYEMFFPEKVSKFTNVDQPWMSSHLKNLDRKRKWVFQKQRRSPKWHKLNKQFKLFFGLGFDRQLCPSLTPSPLLLIG